MTASPALLTKELESAMAKLRDSAASGNSRIKVIRQIDPDEAAALLQHIAALEQRVADLRNRLNLSEKQRFPVDAIQPTPPKT